MNRFFTYFAIVLNLSKHINVFGHTSVPEYLRMSFMNFYLCVLRELTAKDCENEPHA